MALVGVDFRAPLRTVKRVQFGILSPDEIVSKINLYQILKSYIYMRNQNYWADASRASFLVSLLA